MRTVSKNSYLGWHTVCTYAPTMRKSLALLLLVGCSSASDSNPSGGAGPTLVVTSPERATTTESTQVTVTGIATGNQVGVKVNGTAVTPDAQGNFSATIDVGQGIGIIETHATDAAGADIEDVRAVLAGTLGTTDGKTSGAIGARVGKAALTAIGGAVGKTAEGIDFTSLAQSANPVYNNGGCLGAVVDITSISHDAIDVTLSPIADAVGTEVVIHNVVVKLHASYKVACIGGSTTVTIKSSAAHIKGNLGVAIKGGAIATSLPSDTVALDNFDLDVGGLPDALVDLFNGTVRSKVQDALAGIIKSKVPPMADAQLANLVAKPLSTSVLGHTTAFSMVPGTVDLSTDGLFVSVAAKVAVDGGEGGMYLATSSPMSADLLASVHGVGVAVQADLLNQVFGALHATGAFEVSLPISSVGPLAAILDDDATTIDVSLALPPTATVANDLLTLSVGDLMVTTKDASGTIVQQLALSLRTTLTSGPTQDGKLMLTVGSPEVHAQVIEQSDVVQRPLTSDQVQGIVTGVWGIVGSTANSALANVPMPAIAGIQLGAPTVSGKDGFLVADIALD